MFEKDKSDTSGGPSLFTKPFADSDDEGKGIQKSVASSLEIPKINLNFNTSSLVEQQMSKNAQDFLNPNQKSK